MKTIVMRRDLLSGRETRDLLAEKQEVFVRRGFRRA
jgi:hypothetical protein